MSENTSGQKKRGVRAPSPAAPFRLAYESLFAEANAGARPTWDAAKNSQAAGLVKQLGLDEAIRRAENMFRAPPDWPPPPHDIGTLVRHCDRFAVAHRNGKNGGNGKNGHAEDAAARLERAIAKGKA